MIDIKKFLLPALLVGVVGAYVAYEKLFIGQPQAPAGDDNQTSAPFETIAGNQNPSAGAPAPLPAPTSGYNDGEYTGEFADAFYGPVQVKAIIVGGVITDIQFLQFPNHQGHTLELSNQTRPILKTEAIQVQSADVDIVSGATQTSQAFIQSLASALKKAGSRTQPSIQVTPPRPSGV